VHLNIHSDFLSEYFGASRVNDVGGCVGDRCCWSLWYRDLQSKDGCPDGVASGGVFLTHVAGDFVGGSRISDSTFGRHDIIYETFEVVTAADKLLFRNVDGGFISAFFPLLFV
jgi:hypothetical protein